MKGKRPRPPYRMARAALVAAAAMGLLAGARPAATAQPASAGPAAAAAARSSVPAGRPASTTTRPRLATALRAATPPPIDQAAYDTCSSPQTIAKYAQTHAQARLFLAGYADAGKLNGAEVLGTPGGALADSHSADEGLWFANGDVPLNGDLWDCTFAKLQLDDHGRQEFPPATATFLAFGFMPVTATVRITQMPGGQPVTAVGFQDAGPTGADFSRPYTLVTTAQVILRVSAVKVNGVSLDVGPGCRTTRPLNSANPVANPHNDRLVLIGGTAPGDPEPLLLNIAFGGGALAGAVTIPPFTGCGAGGNLDPLLDASVSGSGNDVQMIEGAPCLIDPTGNPFGACTPAEQPESPPLWTISNGGAYSATGPLTVLMSPAGRIICNSAIAGTIGPNPGGEPPRGFLGTITWTDISDCTDSRVRGWTWSVTQSGPVEFSPFFYENDLGGTITGLFGFSIQVHGSGPRGAACDVTATGNVTYNQPPMFTNPSTINLQAGVDGAAASGSRCPFIVNPKPALVATYHLSPGDIMVTNP